MKNEIAVRYAAGLFELAKEEEKIKSYKDQAELLKKSMEETPELAMFLRAVKITKEEKKEVIDQVLAQFDHEMINFVKLLIDKGRSAYLYEILQEFISMCEEELGIEHVTVVSARKLSENDLQTIASALMHSSNKTVILENVVDESVISGIKVISGSTVTDVTMKTKLENLRKELLKGGQLV